MGANCGIANHISKQLRFGVDSRRMRAAKLGV